MSFACQFLIGKVQQKDAANEAQKALDRVNSS